MANAFRAGGGASDTAGELITLFTGVITSTRVSAFRKAGAWTAGYQVPTGKVLYITKLTPTYAADNSACMSAFGYADNDVGLDTTTARTNPVAVLGDPEAIATAGTGDVHRGFYLAQTNTTKVELVEAFRTLHIPIPASKYFYMRAIIGGASTIGWVAQGIVVSV